MPQAIIAGATGLVGSHLLQQLLKDERFARVVTLVRRSTGFTHPRLTEHVVDFANHATWRDLVRGDVLFSTLGTTVKQSGSREAQWEVDYTYQYEVAQAAAANDVATMVLVSAAGASPSSRVFYYRMKGELERDVAPLGFRALHILRPGLLSGRQHQVRAAERIGERVLRAVNAVGLLPSLRPIHADIVARAMINAAFDATPRTVHELESVFTLADR